MTSNDKEYVMLRVPMTEDEFKCWKMACLKSGMYTYNYLRKIIFEALKNDFNIVPTDVWEYKINNPKQETK